MSNTTKSLSERDANQVIQSVYNAEDATLLINGALAGKVGRKVEMTITTTNVANDTEVYNFSELGNALYTLTVIYTDGTRATLLSAERTA